jgi:lysosomal alpha-mannosidase
MAENYRGNVMYLPQGCDFSFANARMNFENMDRMISWFNEHNNANMKMFYSTPSLYLEALAKENITWPVNYDDMFPYADNPQDYWSGYFTSRQAGKKQVRVGQSNLHGST